MIFSLSNEPKEITLEESEQLDIFCFFGVKHSIHCPDELWFEAICSSLRRKHSVLILEKEISSFPQWDPTKRWIASDHWSWLAPRSLSVLLEAHSENSMTYPLFKTWLTKSK